MERIGKGSYGKVYKQDNFAIKIVDVLEYYGFREVIMRAILPDHSNIVKFNFLKINEDNKTLYIKMPLYKYDLDKYIAKHKIDFNNKLALAISIARAVAHMHKYDIVHLDIRPRNILLNDENECVLADFGMSFKVGARIKDFAPQTPTYGAPESIKGCIVTKEMDIWAMGCTLYELLYEQPFMDKYFGAHKETYNFYYGDVDNLYDHIKDKKCLTAAEDDFLKILLKCLYVNPSNRISARQLLYELSRMAGIYDISYEDEQYKCLPQDDYEAFYNIDIIPDHIKNDIREFITLHGAQHDSYEARLALIYITSIARNEKLVPREYIKYLREIEYFDNEKSKQDIKWTIRANIKDMLIPIFCPPK